MTATLVGVLAAEGQMRNCGGDLWCNSDNNGELPLIDLKVVLRMRLKDRDREIAVDIKAFQIIVE